MDLKTFRRRRLGELAVAQGLVTPAQLESLLPKEEAGDSIEPLIRGLTAGGFVDAKQIDDLLQEYHRMKYWHLHYHKGTKGHLNLH